MKRRNVDCGKIRRSVKRNKITEGIYGSTLLYLKFLLLWVFVILADFLLEFRFEFLWPFWLLVRSVYDSYKYQGLAFSVFFVCIALTSDMVCFFFIPVHWLFFAASTYVWVQYVWHTDKGVCFPTIILWMLFVYLEAAVRLKDLRHLPFHLDLCRPFAAHCIGYPVVTLGFGFKSYVGYRIRQRKQRDVAKENEFYAQLLLQALPVTVDTQSSLITQTETVTSANKHVQRQTGEKWRSVDSTSINSHSTSPSNGSVAQNHCLPNGTISRNSHRKCVVDKQINVVVDHNHTTVASLIDTNKKYVHLNGNTVESAECTDRSSCETMSVCSEQTDDSNTNISQTTNECNEKELLKHYKTNISKNNNNNNNKFDNKKENNSAQKNKNKHTNNNNNNSNSNNNNNNNNVNNLSSSSSSVSSNSNNNSTKDCNHEKDAQQAEYIQKLEWDLKRLRTDLQSIRNSEQDLRSQINQLTSSEKCLRTELLQVQRDNEELQNKIHNITSARQTERQALERRVGDERRARAAVEAQLAHERRSQQQQQQAQQHNKGECTEQCKSRRRELECEARDLRSSLRSSEERLNALERERSAAVQQQHDADILMSALSAMQDKNQHLEDSLSAETRIKLDLFSALGEAKRQLEIRDNLIRTQEKEIDELKSKIAQVLAVMPNDTFGNATISSVSSRVRLAESPSIVQSSAQQQPASASSLNNQLNSTPTTSQLDPNATAYTPKNSLVAGTEA